MTANVSSGIWREQDSWQLYALQGNVFDYKPKVKHVQPLTTDLAWLIPLNNLQHWILIHYGPYN